MAGIKIPIEFDAASTSSVGAEFSKLEGHHASLSEKITATSTAFLALKEAFEMGVEVIKKLAEASLAYENANQKLKTTLEVMGQVSSKEAIDSVREFAESMQNASGVSSDLITSITASNVALGMTKEQAMITTQAALGLAKATGVDLTQANQELIGSLAGHARALKMISPEIGALNQMQLAQGNAIDIVAAKYNKFITSDAATTQGTLDRIKVSFEDLTKTIGIDFFQGLDMPGHLGETNEAFELLQKTLADNKEFFVALGQVGAWFVTEVLDVMVASFKTLPVLIRNLVDAFQGLGNMILAIVNAAFTPLLLEIDAVVLAYQKVKSLITGDKTGFQAAAMAIVDDTKRFGTSLDQFTSGMKQFGSGVTGAASSVVDAVTGSVAPTVSTASGLQSPSGASKLGHLNRPLSEHLVQQQAAFQKQIQTEAIDIAAMGTDSIVAEYTKRTEKIVQLQKDAAAKGFDISAQTEALQEALDDKYAVKFRDEQLKQSIAMSDAAGTTIDSINLKYQEQLNTLSVNLTQQKQLIDAEYANELISYQDMIDKKAAMDAKYAAAKTEQDRLKTQATRMTTGSTSTDQMLNTATSFVGSIQGGLNSIIGQIGQMFGPYGTLIAGIIQLFNQTPEQFKKMVQGLMEAARMLPKYLAENIPYLITQIPQILADSVSLSFNLPFWEGVVKSLWQALKDMFHNFWALLFGGDQIGNAMDQAASVKKISFGPNDPNAGNDQFKIKNLNGAKSQADQFQETFASTVQNAGKSFLDYLKDAWNQIITMLDNFFKGVAKTIWNGLMSFIDLLLEWGKKIWSGFVTAANAAISWVEGVGGWIWSGFKALFNAESSIISAIGGSIWNVLKKYFQDGWSLFTDIGGAIWNSLKAAFDLKKLFTDPTAYFQTLGSSIYAGLKTAIAGVGSLFSDLGKQIWDGFKKSVTSIGNVFGGGSSGGGIIGSITGGLSSVANTVSSWFAHGGEVTHGMSNPRVAAAFSSLGALHFAGGGNVPGYGISDSVPAILAPGERVLTRQQNQAFNSGGMGGQVINVTFNVAAGATFDKAAVNQAMPLIVDSLRRMSRNGTVVVRQNGVL